MQRVHTHAGIGVKPGGRKRQPQGEREQREGQFNVHAASTRLRPFCLARYKASSARLSASASSSLSRRITTPMLTVTVRSSSPLLKVHWLARRRNFSAS